MSLTTSTLTISKYLWHKTLCNKRFFRKNLSNLLKLAKVPWKNVFLQGCKECKRNKGKKREAYSCTCRRV